MPLCAVATAQVLVSSFDEKLPKDRFPNAAAYALETARHKVGWSRQASDGNSLPRHP